MGMPNHKSMAHDLAQPLNVRIANIYHILPDLCICKLQGATCPHFRPKPPPPPEEIKTEPNPLRI